MSQQSIRNTKYVPPIERESDNPPVVRFRRPKVREALLLPTLDTTDLESVQALLDPMVRAYEGDWSVYEAGSPQPGASVLDVLVQEDIGHLIKTIFASATPSEDEGN
jgi:hypothetical protein